MSDELKKDDWWYIIKKVTFLICLAGFVANSYMCLKQFIGKETVQSQELKHNKELVLPSFTICSLSGYKKKITKHQDLKLNNYLNNTLELDEILLWVTNDDNMWTIEQLIKDTKSWHITTTYSLYKGRCHTIRYLHKVLKVDFDISQLMNTKYFSFRSDLHCHYCLNDYRLLGGKWVNYG